MLSVCFLIMGIFKPVLAEPLNRLWAQLGLLMAKVTNPIILGLLYYSTIVPIGVFMRIVGKDPLRLKYDRSASSYWIARTPSGPAPETMTNQF